MIQEWVRAGLRRARERGTKSGRPIGRPRISGAVERKVKVLRRKGTGKRKIAGEFGIGVGTVQRILAAAL